MAIATLVGGGCQPERAPAAAATAAQEPIEVAARSAPEAREAPSLPPLEKGQMRRIPAGVVQLGSAPGTAHRDPSLEADLVERRVAAFEIDRLPYPNDPAEAPHTGLNRAQAEAKCGALGKRLCTEFEWERACKADDTRTYATGESLPLSQCEHTPGACQSPFGVARLGTGVREWTASVDKRGIGHPMRTASLRGAGPGAELSDRRCGARAGATPDSAADDLGFRCCRSAEAPAVEPYPVEPKRPLVYEFGADDERVRQVLAAIPQLAAYAEDFNRFTRGEISAALRRGGRSRGSITAWHITSSAFRWSPVRGEEFWVLTGKGQGKALLALLYVLPDGRFAHAGSTVIDEEHASIAVGYTDDKPQQLLWTTCFGCAGESGDIFYGDDATLSFVHR